MYSETSIRRNFGKTETPVTRKSSVVVFQMNPSRQDGNPAEPETDTISYHIWPKTPDKTVYGQYGKSNYKKKIQIKTTVDFIIVLSINRMIDTQATRISYIKNYKIDKFSIKSYLVGILPKNSVELVSFWIWLQEPKSVWSATHLQVNN